jgi:Flagellar protein FliT
VGADRRQLSGPAAPWAAVADLAERELALAREGRWSEVAACSDERVRRAAALPAVPPPQARGELERLASCQDALVALLSAARAGIARELASLRRGRAAARGYGAGPGASRFSLTG